MIAQLERLAERFRDELEDLEREVQRAQKSWQTAKHISADQDVYINSTALNLHSFYSGTERLFEQVAVRLDGGIPTGDAWHQELLVQMTEEKPGIRPPVISTETAHDLDNFRRFRHLIRNVYTTKLNPDKMEDLLSSLPSLWAQLKSELQAFSEFLDLLAQADKAETDTPDK